MLKLIIFLNYGLMTKDYQQSGHDFEESGKRFKRVFGVLNNELKLQNNFKTAFPFYVKIPIFTINLTLH